MYLLCFYQSTLLWAYLMVFEMRAQIDEVLKNPGMMPTNLTDIDQAFIGIEDKIASNQFCNDVQIKVSQRNTQCDELEPVKYMAHGLERCRRPQGGSAPP